MGDETKPEKSIILKEAQEKLELRKQVIHNVFSEKDNKNLDSTIKKTQAFTKAMRIFHDNTKDQKQKLISDIKNLNLKRYIAEIVENITNHENLEKLHQMFAVSGPSKIPPNGELFLLIQCIAQLHMRYPTFLSQFLNALVVGAFLESNNNNPSANAPSAQNISPAVIAPTAKPTPAPTAPTSGGKTKKSFSANSAVDDVFSFGGSGSKDSSDASDAANIVGNEASLSDPNIWIKNLIEKFQASLTANAATQMDQKNVRIIVRLVSELYLLGVLKDPNCLILKAIFEGIIQKEKKKGSLSIILLFLHYYSKWFIGSQKKPHQEDPVVVAQIPDASPSPNPNPNPEPEKKENSQINVEKALEDMMNELRNQKMAEDWMSEEEESMYDSVYYEQVFASETIVPESTQKSLLKMFIQFFDGLCNSLVESHTEMQKREEEKHKALFGKEYEKEKTDRNVYESMRKKWFQIYYEAKILGDFLDSDMPEKVKEGCKRMIELRESEKFQKLKQQIELDGGKLPIFKDEETRQFYEDIPDINELVEKRKKKEEAETAKLENKKQANSAPNPAPQKPKTPQTPQTQATPTPATTNSQPNPEKETGDLKINPIFGFRSKNVDDLINKLQNCSSKSQINDFAVDFALYFNTKSNRKKLVKAMFNIPRTRTDLLPHLSRLVKMLLPLNNTSKENLSEMLIEMLVEQFDSLFEQKDQIKIETKIKNIRFLGELCKFGLVAPPLLLENCLDKLLNDFVHHNIEVTCQLLETCGRYLYAKPETHTRTAQLLNKMIRLKDVKNFEKKYNLMIENAYIASRPIMSDSEAVSNYFTAQQHDLVLAGEISHLPPMHQYIHHLLFSKLDAESVKFVEKQLRKLPWSSDPTILTAVIQTIRNVRNGLCNFELLGLIAEIVAGISNYHEIIGTIIMDRLTEDIRYPLYHLKPKDKYSDEEIESETQTSSSSSSSSKAEDAQNPDAEDASLLATTFSQQRRVLDVKFLGELFNKGLVSSDLIFKFLFMFILYGVNNETDPAEDCFRIRLVCTLLETVFTTLNEKDASGTDKLKLDKFIAYLQRYVLEKISKTAPLFRLPVDIEYYLCDVLEFVRPNLRWPASYQETSKRIQDIEVKKPKQTKSLPKANQEELQSIEIPKQVKTSSNWDETEEEDVADEQDQQSASNSASQNQIKMLQQQKSAEDEEFDRELNDIISESISDRKNTNFFSISERSPGFGVPLFGGGSNLFKHQNSVSSQNSQNSQKKENGKQKLVVFAKGKGKEKFKSIEVVTAENPFSKKKE